ncbi:MAG: DNA translocase FtsK [Patescibacteria group bacterium]
MDSVHQKLEELEKRVKTLEKKVLPTKDELYFEAEKLARQYKGDISPSLLQRKLAIGYARAARLFESVTTGLRTVA